MLLLGYINTKREKREGKSYPNNTYNYLLHTTYLGLPTGNPIGLPIGNTLSKRIIKTIIKVIDYIHYKPYIKD